MNVQLIQGDEDEGKRFKYGIVVKNRKDAEVAIKYHVELLPCLFPGFAKVVKVNGEENTVNSSYLVREFETAQEMAKEDSDTADVEEGKLTTITLLYVSKIEMKYRARRNDGVEYDIQVLIDRDSTSFAPMVSIETKWLGHEFHWPLAVHCCYMSLICCCCLAPLMDDCCQLLVNKEYKDVLQKLKKHFDRYANSAAAEYAEDYM